MTSRRALIATLVCALAISGCGRKKRVSPSVAHARIPSVESGLASWYGHPYHGRPAANGEIYDMEKLTAAHRTLPFGTWVRVTNSDNGKTVDVRIIDRGPFIAGRIIDLSHAAAGAIDLIGPGVAFVRVDVISAPVAAAPSVYAVQAGAFADRGRAERLRQTLEAQYGSARLVPRLGSPTLWRVLVGAESSIEAATELAGRVQAESGAGLVVRLDNPSGAAAQGN
jgi:rare lipoprotein A